MQTQINTKKTQINTKKTQLEQKQDIVLKQMNVLLNNRLVDALKTSTLTIETAKQIKKDIIKDFTVQNRQQIHLIHNFSQKIKADILNKPINEQDKINNAQAIKTTLKGTGFSGFTQKIFTAKPKTIENMELLNKTDISKKFKNISIASDDSKGSISISSHDSKMAFDFLDDYQVQSIHSTNSSKQSSSSDSFVKI